VSAADHQSIEASPRLFHPVTGQFRDRDAERRFRSGILPQVQQDSRLALVVAAILIALFGVSDYVFLGLSRPFYLLMALRTVMIAGCLVLAGVLYRGAALLTRPWLYSVGPLLIATGTILIVPLRPHTLPTQLSAVVMVIVAFYLVVPNMLWGTIGTSVYLTAGFIFAACYWAGVSLLGALPIAVLLIVTNAMGYIVVSRRARLQREQFLLREAERRSQQELIAEVARRKALEEQLRIMAQTDDLTRLSTRRHFMEEARTAFAAARQASRPFSLCMLDVDNFKLINDHWGHVAGDAVLHDVAAACRRALEPEQLLGRFGGEEFVAALPGAGLEEARAIAERLRACIAGLRFDDEIAVLRVTMTIGLAEVQPREDDIAAALKRADAALYQGKRRGGDIVIGDMRD